MYELQFHVLFGPYKIDKNIYGQLKFFSSQTEASSIYNKISLLFYWIVQDRWDLEFCNNIYGQLKLFSSENWNMFLCNGIAVLALKLHDMSYLYLYVCWCAGSCLVPSLASLLIITMTCCRCINWLISQKKEDSPCHQDDASQTSKIIRYSGSNLLKVCHTMVIIKYFYRK